MDLRIIVGLTVVVVLASFLAINILNQPQQTPTNITSETPPDYPYSVEIAEDSTGTMFAYDDQVYGTDNPEPEQPDPE